MITNAPVNQVYILLNLGIIPGSLHHDGVNAQELGRIFLAVVFLRDLWFERAGSGPLESAQLTGESWTTHLVR